MVQFISKKLYKKSMLPFMQPHVLLGQFDEKIDHMKNSKSWDFETKGYKGNDSFIKSFGYCFIFIRFKKI
jgi:hypothetical protein